jgi:hypothetical protein
MVIEQWFIYLANSAYTSDRSNGHPTVEHTPSQRKKQKHQSVIKGRFPKRRIVKNLLGSTTQVGKVQQNEHITR